MGDDGQIFLKLYCSGYCMLLIMLLSIIQMWTLSGGFFGQVLKFNDFAIGQFQVEHEWNQTKFIKDVFVVNADELCSATNKNAEPIFTLDWYGLQPAYRVTGYNKFTQKDMNLLSTDPPTGKNKQQLYPMELNGFPMLQASNFDGKRVCATMMNMAFKDVKTLNSKGQCDTGYNTCSGDGKIAPMNQICVPKLLSEEGCPITSVHFAKDDEADGFKYVDFTQGYKIGYSNTADSLPLTNFRVEVNRPCSTSISNSWTSEKSADNHYLNEYQFGQVSYKVVQDVMQNEAYVSNTHNCAMHQSDKYFADTSRYTNLLEGKDDFKIDLKKFYDQNGITDVMKKEAGEYPNSTIEEANGKIQLQFWVSSALQMPDECLKDDFSSPQDALNRFDFVWKQYKEIDLAKFSTSPVGWRLFLNFFTMIPYAFIVQIPKRWIILVAQIIPLLFLVQTFRAANQRSDLKEYLLAMQVDRVGFMNFSKKCIEPLDMFLKQSLDINIETWFITKASNLEYIIVGCYVLFYVVTTKQAFLYMRENVEDEEEENQSKQPLLENGPISN